MSIDYRREGPTHFHNLIIFNSLQNLLPILSALLLWFDLLFTNFCTLWRLDARNRKHLSGFRHEHGWHFDRQWDAYLHLFWRYLLRHGDTFFDKTNRGFLPTTFTRWLNKFGNQLIINQFFLWITRRHRRIGGDWDGHIFNMSSTEDIEFEEVELVEAEKTKDENLKIRASQTSGYALGPIIDHLSLKHPCWKRSTAIGMG